MLRYFAALSFMTQIALAGAAEIKRFESDCNAFDAVACQQLGISARAQGEMDLARSYFSLASELTAGKLGGLDLGAMALREGNRELASRHFREACTAGSRSGCVSLKALRTPTKSSSKN